VYFDLYFDVVDVVVAGTAPRRSWASRSLASSAGPFLTEYDNLALW
jgi:hypothetical protein